VSALWWLGAAAVLSVIVGIAMTINDLKDD
jgi:ABC-type nickel/cobalt efflux system permease component RcnA